MSRMLRSGAGSVAAIVAVVVVVVVVVVVMLMMSEVWWRGALVGAGGEGGFKDSGLVARKAFTRLLLKFRILFSHASPGQ